MLEYDRIDISEGIHVNKTSESKGYGICHYWYFRDIGFKYEPHLCNDAHNLTQKDKSFSDVSIFYVKESAYRIHFWYMSKDDAIGVMNDSNLINKNSVIIYFTIYKKWLRNLIIKETEMWY